MAGLMLWGHIKTTMLNSWVKHNTVKIRRATYFNIMCDNCADKTSTFLMQIEWIKSAIHVYECLSLHNHLCIVVGLWLCTSVCVHVCHVQVHRLWIIKLAWSVFNKNTLGGHMCFMNLLCVNIWMLLHSVSITDIWCDQFLSIHKHMFPIYQSKCSPFITQSALNCQIQWKCSYVIMANSQIQYGKKHIYISKSVQQFSNKAVMKAIQPKDGLYLLWKQIPEHTAHCAALYLEECNILFIIQYIFLL